MLLKKSELFELIPCHRRNDRSIFIKGKKMTLCARCTAIFWGYLTLPILFLIFNSNFLLLGVLFNLPMIIDGLSQNFALRESNNFLRVLTGILSGIGQSMLIVYFSFLLVKLLL